ncbi:hypothetical protein D3C81_1396630 [compost metagenome]
MAGIAQHFHSLQMGIQQRQARRNHVDECSDATRLEHPAHLAQRLADIPPVVRGIAAEDEVEFAIGERQALRHTLLGADVAQATLGGGRRHHIEHLGRQVIGDDLTGQRRDMEAHMPCPTAQIQHPRPGSRRQSLAQLGELFALGVHGTAQIGGRLGTELALDHLLMATFAHVALLWGYGPRLSRP